MNKNELGLRISDDRDEIIEMYRSDVDIKEIAHEYHVTTNTMCRRLKEWGIKIKKGDWHQEYYDKRKPKYTRRFSPELIERMKKNTAINRRYIKNYGK